MNYIFVSLIGYILGSIPTAYLLLKYSHGLDIRENGSKNVGALNSFQVSNSKVIGIITLFVDLFKGFLSVFIAKLIGGNDFMFPMLALIFAVIGHCYSPWLKFNGGRGLATAAGGSIFFIPAILIVWTVLWIIAYLFKRDVHFGNISATILTAAIAVSSSDILAKYSLPPTANSTIYGLLIAFMMLIILTKHWEQLKIWFTQQKIRKGKKDEKF